MKTDIWPTKNLAVASLHLDTKNPRLGRESGAKAPREIIQYLFEHDKAVDVAESIAIRGFFPNEPLLAIEEGGKYVVVEGNRRLAALKALKEPGVLEGAHAKHVERLSKRISDLDSISTVPVTIAPNRKATNRLIAGRHVGTPVLAWQAENRASFILDRLEEGYDNKKLQEEMGFTASDIQEARQTRAIADMARSLDLPDEVRAKLDNPRAKVFSTIERVFDSTVGRQYLQVEPDADFGIRGRTKRKEFVRVFTRLVCDVTLEKVTSRSLNSSESIEKYFQGWKKERPKKIQGSFYPADIIGGKTTSAMGQQKPAPSKARAKAEYKTVLPKDFRVIFGNEKLVDIRRELTKLKREKFPNAGAVLLRVFFELSVLEYLKRTGDLDILIKKLESKGGKLKFGVPTLKDMVPEINRIAQAKLKREESNLVEKAVRYDPKASFTLSDLHSFVHQPNDLPTEADIRQFWKRTEPLFRLMLETDLEIAKK